MESLCQQAQHLLSDLLGRDLDSAELEQLDRHLTGCGFCREQAQLYWRLHRALGELAAQNRRGEIEAGIRAALQGAEPEPAPTEARPVLRTKALVLRPLRRHGRWLAAAVLLLALGIGWHLWKPWSAAPEAVAQLEEVRGEVYRLEASRRIPAASGQELGPAQGLVTVGEGSAAAIVFPDGTRLDVGPDSLIDCFSEGSNAGSGSGKHVSLVEGFLTAEVTKQPEGQPMVLVTPHARVVVQGTRLNLVNLAETTRIEVEKGAVEVAGHHDGRSVQVTAGSFSIVGAADDPLVPPRPMPTQVTQPRLRLPDGSGRVLAAAFAPDGRMLASGGKDGKVRIWDLTRGEEQTPLVIEAHPREEVRSLAYSPDGRLLAVGGDERHHIKLFDPATGQEVATLTGHRTWIETLVFTPDSRTLVVAGAHGQEAARIYFWDVERRQAVAWVQGHVGGVWAAVLSPDGQTLATAGRDGTIKFWDINTRELQRTIPAHTHEVTSLAFSPDGRSLISGSKDRTAKLWDVGTGRERHTLARHAYHIRGVAFAPDGKTVASSSPDGTVRWWDVAEGRELITFREHGSGVWGVAFSPDGKTLASCGWFRDVLLWDLPPR